MISFLFNGTVETGKPRLEAENVMKKIIKSVLFVFLFGLTSSPAIAQVEKCQDKEGKWHYGSGLGSVCENASEIKTVKTDNVVRQKSDSETSEEENLAKIELKMVGKNEHLTRDIDTVLAPHKTEQDVQNRFNNLKQKTENNIREKITTIQALNTQNKQLRIDKANSNDTEQKKIIDVKISENTNRISSLQEEVSQLNIELDQIEQRRNKVLLIFRQFKYKDKQKSN